MKLSVLTASALVAVASACEPAKTYEQADLSSYTDPWDGVLWNTDADACFNPQIDDQIVDGIYYKATEPGTGSDLNVDHRAAVVHDPDGNRIACGLINFDIWWDIDYESTENGTAGPDSVALSPVWGFETGSTESGKYVNAYGRVVVVHAENGDRVGCGCCVGVNQDVPISAYPGTNSTVSGKVTVVDGNPGYVVMQPELTGLQPSVKGGVHIHVGTTCSSADLVGGHLYRFNGAQMGTYPDYTGGKVVLGFVDVEADTDHSIKFSTALVNDAADGVPASATGGVHIHTGLTCDDASAVGGHLYNTTTASDAPMAQLAFGVAGIVVAAMVAAQ